MVSGNLVLLFFVVDHTDMVVFDHLSFLELFLMTIHRNGTPMPELYQMVQQAGNVLARLYLLITVGTGLVCLPSTSAVCSVLLMCC